MHKSFHNSGLFRVFAPIIFGFIVYVLILLIFDTINELNKNFFSAEVILTIFISYLISEFNRILINSIDKRLPSNYKLSYHIIIQLALTSILVLTITSLAVGLYMNYLVGFKSYETELIVFNSIFFTFNLSYNLMYFNMLYTKIMGKSYMAQAEQTRKESEIELEAYKSSMNPELLNRSLETLICYATKDPEIADNYILKISNFYRSILNNKRTELVDLEKELKTAENYISLQNSWNNDNIIFANTIDESSEKLKIVPGTLYVYLEHIISNSIISPILPLRIVCKTEDNQLIVECFKRDKINKSTTADFEIERLLKAYKFYSDSIPTINDEGEKLEIRIPLFRVAKN